MFGKTYAHTQMTYDQAAAMDEIHVIDALRVGLIAAQIRAGELAVDAAYLDRFDRFLANRKRGLLATLGDAGMIYARHEDGEVRPLWFRGEERKEA